MIHGFLNESTQKPDGNFMHPNPRANSLSDIAEMPVMRQVDDLPHLSHSGQQPDRFFGPEVVERFHYVIGNEWHRWARSGKLMVTGHPQCEIELESCALGQHRHDF